MTFHPEILNTIDTSPRARMHDLAGYSLDRADTFERLGRPIEIRVSDLEHMYPWLLCVTHGIDPREVLPPPSLDTKGAHIGSMLHRADALFSIIVHGGHPDFIHNIAPTLRGLELKATIHALKQVRQLRTSDHLTALTNGWDAYMEVMQRGYRQAQTLFDFATSGDTGDTTVDREYDTGLRLAQVWATAVDDFSDQWEFSPKHLTVREVSTIIPMKLRLIVKARVDSAALHRTGDVAQLQLTDLKTGRVQSNGTIAQQILEYQGRLMELAGVVILPNIVNAKELKQNIPGWPLAVKFDANKLTPIRFGWRRFDQDSGDMQTTWLDDSRKDRQEFYEWLKWFSIILHTHYHEYKLWHKTHG